VRPDGRGLIEVRARGGPYFVHVGPGVLERVPTAAAESARGGRVAVISDDRVGPIHGERVAELCTAHGLEVTYLTFRAGEASKTRKSWSILTDQMLDAGLGRDSCVVAVGGGVTTDLGGFVAATYLRGVPVVQVPTSYLAMIDASVGGKTGVDVRAGKNLVGAFHPPAAVLADTAVLSTLPREERAQGLVEAFKHGAILDEAYFAELTSVTDELLAADTTAATAVVSRSVQLKAEVVENDEFEGGRRQILNFGHTIGHAIEAASDYALGHGSAVALGMLAEAWIGEQTGVTSPGVGGVLAAALEPLLDPGEATVEASDALAYLSSDKKARGGRPRFVLLDRIGQVAEGDGWTHSIDDELVAGALTRVLDRS